MPAALRGHVNGCLHRMATQGRGHATRRSLFPRQLERVAEADAEQTGEDRVERTSTPPCAVRIQVDYVTRLDEYRLTSIVAGFDQVDDHEQRLAVGAAAMHGDR